MGSIVIREYNQTFKAETARGLLEEAGIECILSGDDLGGSLPQITFTTGYRIIIREEDAPKAEEVLAILGEYTPPKGMGLFRS